MNNDALLYVSRSVAMLARVLHVFKDDLGPTPEDLCRPPPRRAQMNLIINRFFALFLPFFFFVLFFIRAVRKFSSASVSTVLLDVTSAQDKQVLVVFLCEGAHHYFCWVAVS